MTIHKSQSGIGQVIRRSPAPKPTATNTFDGGTQSKSADLDLAQWLAAQKQGAS